MDKIPNIAHIDTNKNPIGIQSLEDHAKGVAKLASQFASEFGMADWGQTLGLLHDKGKERKSFQCYLKTMAGIENSWRGEEKQHAYVGAALTLNKFGQNGGIFLSYPIMGHHSGLDDYCNFEKKIKQIFPSEIDQQIDTPKLAMPQTIIAGMKDKHTLNRSMHHIIRMLYSCLVDADFLDTENFMDAEHSRLRNSKATLAELAPKLDSYLDNISKNATKNSLNTLRQQIQSRCNDMAEAESGVFSLTVPTGGGKTLSSLVWAINHALKNGKKRIIIAIPYTSIVTQTAEILSNIFGRENVLEHHSNNDIQKIKDEKLQWKMKLATENWDYPITVTTNVQLFESMMSNKPSSCRKLHNICNSVLILDEVQTLPLEHLQPIVDTLQTYQRIFGVSILFTTASLPALRGDICWGKGSNCKLRGIENITEIIPDEWQLHDKLRRTKLLIDYNPIDGNALAQRLAGHDRVLCIVNTRKEAKSVYEALPDDGLKIHLSRMMCSAHLRKAINEVKTKLKDDSQKVIRVVTTQLIEAGVDIDFPVVYRQEAGLDSVLQAAGRCNREGKMDISDVHVFRLEKKPNGSIGTSSDAMRSLEYNDPDWYAPTTMTEYFIQRYSRNSNFDKADFDRLLYKPFDFQFETAADQFRMIDDDGSYTVIVNYEGSASLIGVLRQHGPSYPIMKKLSQYTVNVRKSDFEKLMDQGLVDEILEGIFYIPDRSQYREDIGLVIESHWLEEILTI